MSIRTRRLGEVVATRWWPTVVAYALLAMASTFSNQPGRYVGDNRFDQFWNPGRRVARQFLAWDPQRGLGREREDFWPGVTWPLAWLRGVGLDPVATQRLWHAAILVAAGVGMVAVLRLVRPRIGPEHLLAGLVVMFGAYSATFLVPSNLAANFALAPWLIVIFVRGVSGNRWRWAAVFALVVFAAGTTDPPGLVLAATPLLAVAVYLVHVERTVAWRHVAAWAWRAGVLALGAGAAALMKLWIASGPFSQRLGGTELPEVSSSTSSWSESMRGLGHWRSYFLDVVGPALPQGFPYFNNPLILFATFVVPVVAVLTLGSSRWRPRLLFGLMMLVSVLLMVAAFPIDAPAPFGSLLLRGLTDVEVLGSLRNTYKAGAGLVVGSAALFGFGVVAAVRWLADRRRSLAIVAGVVVAGAVALTTFPFWSGRLYDPRTTLDSVPAYWDEASAFLDARGGDPAAGAVLVLPGAGRAPYRWGWPGDDLYEARTDRPVVERIGVPLSAPLSANLVDAIAAAANDPGYQRGTLGPVLRRLGVTQVVVRNDLAWGGRVGPRPAAFEGLRNDPDLVLAATFGRPGENTTAPDDESPLTADERALPPVEVFDVVGAQGGVRAPATLPPLVVSGDGAAWLTLAESGFLDGDRPVLYSASAAADQLVDVLDAGGGVVITDTNRRQLRVQIAYDPDRSYLLAEGQDLDRRVPSLFDVPGSESVAWFPDAIQITADGSPRGSLGTQAWIRPANAFDRDPSTEWIASAFDGPLRRTLTVRLRQPQTLDRISLEEARTDDEPFITGVSVGFSDGSTVEVPMANGRGEATFPARTTDWVTVRADELPEVDGRTIRPLGLGFTEITLGGLDLREFVQVPDDLVRRAKDDPQLAAALSRAPTTYLFSRATGTEFLDPAAGPLASDPVRNRLESVMRRRFHTLGSATWELQAVVVDQAATAGGSAPVDGAAEDCADRGLRVDGKAVSLRVTGPAPAASDGASRVRVAACNPLELSGGWHLLVTADPLARFDEVQLRTGPPLAEEPATRVDLTADDVDPAGFGGRIVAPAGAVVSIGQGWDPRWQATLDGADLGPPLALDTLTAWVVPATDGGELHVVFGPTAWLRAAFVASLLTVVLCGWLAVRRRPTAGVVPDLFVGAEPAGPAMPDAGGRQVVSVRALAVIAAAALLLIGWWAVPAVVVAVALAWRRRPVPPVFGVSAAVGLAVAAVVTAINARPGSASVLAPGAPGNVGAEVAGRVAGAFLVVLLLVSGVVERASARSGLAAAAATPRLPRRAWQATWDAAVGTVARWWPVGLAAVGAAGAMVWGGSARLPGGLAAAVEPLTGGFDPGGSVASALGVEGPVAVAPLGPVVVAFAPVPASWSLAIAAVAAVVVVARAAYRFVTERWRANSARAWSIGAAVVTAAAIAMVRPSLPWVLALAAMVGAALLVDPVRLDGRRAAAAGLCIGASILAVPVAAALGAVLVGWAAWRSSLRLGAVVAVVAGLVVAPWAVWMAGPIGWNGTSTAWLWTAGSNRVAVVVMLAAAAVLLVAIVQDARHGDTKGRGLPK